MRRSEDSSVGWHKGAEKYADTSRTMCRGGRECKILMADSYSSSESTVYISTVMG